MDKNCFCLILLLLCIFQVCKQTESDSEIQDIDEDLLAFEDFKKKFEKSYSVWEESAKKINFFKNLATLKSINCGISCQITTYFDLNAKQLQRLRGLKPEEMVIDPNILRVEANLSKVYKQKALRTDDQPSDEENLTSSTTETLAETKVFAYPTTMNWNTSGVVTPIKNQGNCGSCWAFATVAFFQVEAVMTKGFSVGSLDLAEQFLLKCDASSSGCSGGSCLSSSSMVISKGIPLESSYPYDPTRNYQRICKATAALTFTGSKLVYYYGRKLTDDQIIGYLQKRPVIVYVTATYWYMYDFNVSRTFSCRPQESNSSSTMNHAVLLVGYTETEWIIKNSWGTGYGDGGYIYLSRTPSANCGIGFFLVSLA